MEKQLIKMNKLLFSLLENNSLDEIEDVLTKIITLDERKLNDAKVSNIKIKVKSQPKFNKEIYTGRIFEIYLNDIKKYTYGVILKGNMAVDKTSYFLIGYLESFTDYPKDIDRIFEEISKREFSMIAITGYYSIRNYLWKPVGTYETEIFREDELDSIPYVASFNGEHYLSIGDPLKEILLCNRIDGERAAKIKNPHGILGDVSAENRLVEKYNNQVSKDEI